MPDNLLSQLFDFGALGVFAGFLIWQHLGMQKRLDTMVEKFQNQLREIERSHEERVEIMRERYDVVINKVRAEGAAALKECMAAKNDLRDHLGDQIEESTRLTATALVKQDVALAKLDEGLTEMRLRREVRRIKNED